MKTHWIRLALQPMIIAVMSLLLSALPAIALERSAPSTADHSQFKSLQGPFKSGPDVTKACLNCHTEASKQLQKKPHTGRGSLSTQKQDRCSASVTWLTALRISSIQRCRFVPVAIPVTAGTICASHHLPVVQQWTASSVTTAPAAIKKSPTGAGHPRYAFVDPVDPTIQRKIDLAHIAQNIGATSRQNCGSCHFYGGGGDGVKHGDLDSSLLTASRSLMYICQKMEQISLALIAIPPWRTV